MWFDFFTKEDTVYTVGTKMYKEDELQDPSILLDQALKRKPLILSYLG